MDYKQTLNRIKPELDKVVMFLEKEVDKIRTGRASASLVEDVTVECFGQRFPLKQLAAISNPEPKQIVIQPWDRSYLEPIERALSNTGIGANPIVDKDIIRITLPPMSDDYRKSLLRILADKQEEARKTIRHWRTEIWEEIQNRAKAGEIREDDKFRAKDELQKMVDDYGKKVDDIGEKKRKEVQS